MANTGAGCSRRHSSRTRKNEVAEEIIEVVHIIIIRYCIRNSSTRMHPDVIKQEQRWQTETQDGCIR